ncbi:hypothetical protein LRG46_003244 [Salmonella enterica]|nr:hypothetical protein [Salmonella enterica subsp. enterica serovar Sandiego]EIO8763670.1 hypothetical protein [Salmonella enterica]
MSVTIIEDIIGLIFDDVMVNEDKTELVFRRDYWCGEWGMFLPSFMSRVAANLSGLKILRAT